jgi:hypothetical protein
MEPNDGIQMFCLICFKVIRLDRSLLAADFARLGINRLAALSSHLQQGFVFVFLSVCFCLC